jgi:Flp pilus assembly protein TadD
MTAQEAIQQGNTLLSMNRLPEAAASFRQAVEIAPQNPEAVTLLGLALGKMGAVAQAVKVLEHAVRLRPDLGETHCNLGNALCDAGNWEGAIAASRRATELSPNLAGAHSNLGNAYHGIGELDQAVACYRKALELAPCNVPFLNNLAVVLREQKHFAESIEVCRNAIRIQPNDAQSHTNLGSALASIGQSDEAEAEYKHSLVLRPDHPETCTDLGHVYYFRGDFNRAVEVYRQVLRRNPNDAQAHWSLALILLTCGQFAEGWQHYEWRWRVKELRMRLRTEHPIWNGSDLNGKTILIHNEQGFGDTIQFIRYLPRIAARGAKIILACQPELFGLLEKLPYIDRCVPNDQPAPACDVCCPLLSLPGMLGTRAENIPSQISYLSAAPEKTAYWRIRLSENNRKKIGLVWAGRPTHANDRNRSMSLDSLAGLAAIQNAHWISLQKGEAAGQIKTAPFAISDWTNELNDFSDTAALIANLDLVICVDTAIAHLAGALGKPAWVLLPLVPDWRWMIGRADSPWYPSVRLFRQDRVGDWRAPIEKIREALQIP